MAEHRWLGATRGGIAGAALPAALSVALVGSMLGASTAAAKASPVAGDLDADVLHARTGKQIGTVHGSIDGRRGFAVFIPARSGTASARLWLHAERVEREGGRRSRLWRLTGAEGDARVRIFQRANSQRITGRGVAPDGTRVRIRGYGGMPRPDVGKGVLLQLGTRLGGEVKDALRRNYRLRSVSPHAYRRSRLLAHPKLLDRVAGVVVGRDISPRRLKQSGLLRALASGHRWVVIAGATNARLKTLRGILPVTRGPGTAPAVAMRLNGAKGGSDAKRAVIIHPQPPPTQVQVTRGGRTFTAPVPQDAKLKRRLRAQRVAYFSRQLRRVGVAYARPGGSGRATRQASGTLNADCLQAGETPATGSSVASCYQVDVQTQESMQMLSPANVQPSCVAERSGNHVYYCPGDSEWSSLAGSSPQWAGAGYLPTPQEDATACAQGTADTDYWTVIVPTLGGVTNNPTIPVAAWPTEPFFGNGWVWGHEDEIPGNQIYSYRPCPTLPASAEIQVALYPIQDTYFALFEPVAQQQGVLTQVNGVITPNNTNQDGGPGLVGTNGGFNYPNSSTGHAMNEDAWMLGGAQTLAQYVPPTNLGASQPFDYAQPPNGQSFPTNQITDTQESSTQTSTSGWQVGVATSGKSVGGSFSWSESQSLAVETEVDVPDWTVIPNSTVQTQANGGVGNVPVGTSNVVYNWESNTPISYASMQCTTSSDKGCGQPFGSASLNTLNGSSWAPSSQTQWSGDQTGGYPVANTTHQWSFADHYTGFWSSPCNGWGNTCDSMSLTPVDAFQVATFSAGSSSTYSGGQFGSQELDLCDPLVTTSATLPPLC